MLYRSKLFTWMVTAIALTLVAATGTAVAGTVIRQFGTDPTDPSATGSQLIVEGPGFGQFTFIPGTDPAYPSDRTGSFQTHYDAVSETSRAMASLGEFYTENDDFFFGAVLTIQSDGFHADPFGFHPISFSLLNSTTSGFNRTGNLNDFRADTFDTLDVAYFPQVSPFFGGPFLSPGIFGQPETDDAFSNFAFGTVQTAIPLSTPVVILAEHLAGEQKLRIQAFDISDAGQPVLIPNAHVEASLSSLSGFAVDSLAITAYQDGFNIFAPSGQSLNAIVEYHRIFFAPGRLGEKDSPRSLTAILHMSETAADGLSNP